MGNNEKSSNNSVPVFDSANELSVPGRQKGLAGTFVAPPRYGANASVENVFVPGGRRPPMQTAPAGVFVPKKSSSK